MLKSLKTAALFILLIVEVIIIIPFLSKGVKDSIVEIFPELQGKLNAEFALRGVKAFGSSDDGSRYDLTMARGSFYQKSNEITGNDFTGTFIDKKNKPTIIESKVMFYNLNTQTVNVPSPGTLSIPGDGILFFNSIIYDRIKEHALAKDESIFYHPSVEEPQVKATGHDADYDKNNKVIHIDRDFTVNYYDKKDKKKELLVVSDKGLINLEGSRVDFINNVHLTQQQTSVTCEHMEVTYKKGVKNSGVAVASGNVQITDTQYNRRAYSQQAVFDQVSNQIVLTGLPVVEQGGDKLAGEMIKFYRENDFIEVINASAKIRHH